MRISDKELNKVVQQGGIALVLEGDQFESSPRESDQEMIHELVQNVVGMPADPVREARVAELREQIARGEYRPTGEDIADAMVRRAIADRIRP